MPPRGSDGGRNGGRDTKGPFLLIYFPPLSVRKRSQLGIGSARLRERPDMKESSQDRGENVCGPPGAGGGTGKLKGIRRDLMTGNE